jgi:hypothetical protein
MCHVRDIALEAYQQAVEYFERELQSKADVHTLIVARATSIEEVHAIVYQAKARYESSKIGRRGISKGLQRLSSRIMYYSGALDVLAQHHPEVGN